MERLYMVSKKTGAALFKKLSKLLIFGIETDLRCNNGKGMFRVLPRIEDTLRHFLEDLGTSPNTFLKTWTRRGKRR